MLIICTAELLHLFTDEQIQPSGFGCNLAFAVDLLPGMAACRRFLIGVPPGEMHRARLQAAIAFLITDYPQPTTHGTKQERMAVSVGSGDGAQQGSVSKGPQ